MNDAERAEHIVRTLHGKVPSWASGAVVDRPDTAELSEDDRIWFEDATFEDVGHTGISSCHVTDLGAVRFKVVRRPSRQAIRKYGAVPVYPRMLEVIETLDTGAIEAMHKYGLGRGRIAQLGDSCLMLGAVIGNETRALAMILGKHAPYRIRTREPLLGFVSPDTGEELDVGSLGESIFATLALARRYEWRVAMRIDGAPALTFACTPGSARAAFRLRDLPPGKNRRDALLHWVCEHYRNPDIHVNEHLRGKHVFSWRGIDCEIVPSAHDREKEIARKALRRA